MLKEKKTTTQSKIPFLWLQPRLPIHKRESRNKAGLIGCSEASEPSRTGVNYKAFCGLFSLWFENLTMTKNLCQKSKIKNH
jgi:hypothetical protein